MKSKTPRTSKNSRASVKAADPPGLAADLASALSAGHRPVAALSPQDEALFRAFQSNLLSLISHELRTPLTGILNPLEMLREGESAIPQVDLIEMAHSNAKALHRALATLLDLASIESGSYHARMRETELSRLVQSKIASSGLDIETKFEKAAPILADPQRLGRAIELCLQVIAPRIEAETKLGICVTQNEIRFSFRLPKGTASFLVQAWSQAEAGFRGGVASPGSAFGGVLQSEEAFLSRSEEGLGSEFLLIFEIMRLHQGKFSAEKSDDEIHLTLTIPELASEEGLRFVLRARAYHFSTEIGSVALVILKVPAKVSSEFNVKLKENLFRASDAVYPMGKQVAVVLDDCKAEDVPKLIVRLKKALGQEIAFGWAQVPADGQDPDLLLALALKRLKENS